MSTLVFKGGFPGLFNSISRHMSTPLITGSTIDFYNITFHCKDGQRIEWNGLPFLAALTWIFPEEKKTCYCSRDDDVTIVLPENDVDVVRKVLVLISRGSVDVSAGQIGEAMALIMTLVR